MHHGIYIYIYSRLLEVISIPQLAQLVSVEVCDL